MFLTLVKTAGSDRHLIQSATLTVTYDLLSSQPSPIPGEPQDAYTCDVSIVDGGSSKEWKPLGVDHLPPHGGVHSPGFNHQTRSHSGKDFVASLG
jgi:hypothetical protein